MGISGGRSLFCEVGHVLSLAHLLSARAGAAMPVSSCFQEMPLTSVTNNKEDKGKDEFGQISDVS